MAEELESSADQDTTLETRKMLMLKVGNFFTYFFNYPYYFCPPILLFSKQQIKYFKRKVFIMDVISYSGIYVLQDVKSNINAIV